MTADTLRHLFPDLFRDLSSDDYRTLVEALEERQFSKGDRLTTWGQAADTLHLVVEGDLSVHAQEASEDLVLGRAGPGSMVGEVGLIDPGTSSATVEALGDVSTLSLPRERFEQLASRAPSVASAVLRALSMELVRRLRRSSRDLLTRIDDHRWMRLAAREDRKRWFERIADLVTGQGGARQ